MKVYSRDKYLMLSELDGLADHQLAMQLPANKKWRGGELQFVPSVAAVSYKSPAKHGRPLAAR